MPTSVTTIQFAERGGYNAENGQFVSAPPTTPLQSTAFAEGQTIGSVVECGGATCARLQVSVSAVSGTNPTLDVYVETSPDGLTSWRSVADFDQKSAAGLAMTAVSSAGTTPPTITLTGTANRYINLKVICTVLGARGTAEIKYSLDGGKTYSASTVTAATMLMSDPVTGESTGVTLNYASATAAVDNVWTAKTAGFERKTFGPLDRFLRCVAVVGGSATPIVTASVTGEFV
jgi:hypothetical protein